MGIFELLGAAFIVLKLMGIITWSWWLVTMPLYLGLLLTALIFFIVLKVMK